MSTNKLGICKWCGAIIALADIAEGELLEVSLPGGILDLPPTTLHIGCSQMPTVEYVPHGRANEESFLFYSRRVNE